MGIKRQNIWGSQSLTANSSPINITYVHVQTFILNKKTAIQYFVGVQVKMISMIKKKQTATGHIAFLIYTATTLKINEPPRGKTNNRIVQFLFYLNLKFQGSNSFLCL